MLSQKELVTAIATACKVKIAYVTACIGSGRDLARLCPVAQKSLNTGCLCRKGLDQRKGEQG